jgi:proton glutamate symport protein
MSLTNRILIALVAGLSVGVFISWNQGDWLLTGVSWVEPIGTLWVNGIRMTVIPLVVSLLVTGLASTSAGRAARIGGRTLAVFVALVTFSALVAAILAPPLLSLASFDANAFAALRENTSATQMELPPFRDWIVGLIPSNPVRAAADGTMLPLVVFSVIFAMAITRLEARHKQTLVDFFEAITRTMIVVIEWILMVAPVGVFCLVVPLAARTGADLVGAMGVFLLIACGLVLLVLVALYPVAVLIGRIPLGQFARAMVSPQTIGFSTRSSLASLPAQLDAANDDLKLPERVTAIVLPVAVALLKYASPTARITGTFFIARLYGIELGVVEIAAITGAVAALSFYSPGLPSSGLLIMAPIYIAFNLPMEGIGLLIALDVVVDMFITAANVTANVTVAVLIARFGDAGVVGTESVEAIEAS